MKTPISKTRLKIPFLEWHPDLPGANELNSWLLTDPCKCTYPVFAEDISLGDGEQQGVGDLAGSAGHQHGQGVRLKWDKWRLLLSLK